MSETPSRIIIQDLPLALEQVAAPEEPLRRQVLTRLGAAAGSMGDLQLRILRRALDARGKPRFMFTVEVSLPAPLAARAVRDQRGRWAQPPVITRWRLRTPPSGPRPVVIGAGPAGLFAALTLAEAGWPPLVLERGRPVEQRSRDVSALYARGQLNPESNVCFGEGGAGTYSDGKLYTRVNDPRVAAFLHTLVELGADPDIEINARPHIGTDRLVLLLEAMRARLVSLGAELRFDARVDDFTITDGALEAITLHGGERIDVGPTVLATGHSARELIETLQQRGVRFEPRPFAVGFRVEHPQAMIDTMRYGRYAGHEALPAADYRLTHQEPNRGVYSFCMCPGGVVVATPTRPEELCINGMSHASRSGRFANSALVVTVTPEDFATWGHHGFHAGARFQEHVERAAYHAGGGDFVAPASNVEDFMRGRVSTQLGSTSYRRGLSSANLAELYPAPVIEALRHALTTFDKKMRGFVTTEAKLIGVETRTASPVRLPRDETHRAVGVENLYPSGEGLGYGGGIASAAVDGTRVAESILERAGAQAESRPSRA